MSDAINQELLDRASEVKTYFEGTDLETAIDNLVAQGDLEALQYMITDAEAEIARQEFNNNDMLAQNDIY